MVHWRPRRNMLYLALIAAPDLQASGCRCGCRAPLGHACGPDGSKRCNLSSAGHGWSLTGGSQPHSGQPRGLGTTAHRCVEQCGGGGVRREEEGVGRTCARASKGMQRVRRTVLPFCMRLASLASAAQVFWQRSRPVHTMSTSRRTLVVGVGGPTSSGKTTLAKHLLSLLPTDKRAMLHQDDFALPEEQLPWNEKLQARDWDSPIGTVSGEEASVPALLTRRHRLTTGGWRLPWDIFGHRENCPLITPRTTT